MDRDFWLDSWANNRIEFHQQDVNPSLQAHWPRLGLPPRAGVFVPLCGKSRDMLWLRAQGHEVFGVELAEAAVRAFFDENALVPNVQARPPFVRWEAQGISIWRGDFFDLAPADLADVAGVYDRAALIALPPDMRRRYAARFHELLRPGAAVLLLTVQYPQDQMEGPPFSVSEAEVRTLYGGGFDVELLTTQDAFRPDSALARRGLKQLEAQAYRLVRRAG